MPGDRNAMGHAGMGFQLGGRAVSIFFIAGLTLPSAAQAQVWTVDPDPVLSIGGLAEDPDYILSNVVGGLRLADGRVVLADRFTNGLRVYSPDGMFIEDIGREGEGPGEYEYIRGMDRCGGSPVVAFDLHWDMKLYDSQLQLVEERSATLPGIGGTPYGFDCGPSGHWIATGWGKIAEQNRPGYFVATAPVALGIGDSVIVNFGERLSSERIGTVTQDGTPTGSGPHPFGRMTSVAIGPGRVYLGDASDFRIEVFDLQGNPLPPIEWHGPDREITRGHLETYGSALSEGVTADRAPALRRWLRDLPKIEQFPAYDELRVDQTGNLWIRYFQRPGETATQWVVFDEVGNRVGGITFPQTTSLLDIGSDYLLVVEHDALDVATVRLYRLLKSGSPPGINFEVQHRLWN